MKLHAVMYIDDDRWKKYPFSITLFDENDTVIYSKDSLRRRVDCDRVIEQARKEGHTVDDKIDERHC